MLKDIAPKGKATSVRHARRLRRAMTLPEVLVWTALRKRPAGLKFRRQHPCGGYILDFFCSDARLALEIDGEAHNRGGRPERDQARDVRLAETGIQTFRISAADVLRDIKAVIIGIVMQARGRLPLHHPASPDGPPPRDKLGED